MSVEAHLRRAVRVHAQREQHELRAVLAQQVVEQRPLERRAVPRLPDLVRLAAHRRLHRSRRRALRQARGVVRPVRRDAAQRPPALQRSHMRHKAT